MELPRVYVLCAAVALTLVEVCTVPVAGLLSGLFGGEDPRPKPTPVDINQLLRQYYSAQTEDQLARYNPFGPLGGPISYGQLQPGYDPYPSLEPALPYQANPGYGAYNGDPYAQLLPLYQTGSAHLPGAAEAAGGADRYSKLDSLLPSGREASPYVDLANYRSLSNSAPADAQPQAAVQTRIDVSQSNSPVASSLLTSSSSSNSAAQIASLSSTAGNSKE